MGDQVKDYVTEYRQFFEKFASTVDLKDQLPVKVASYNLAKFEITGEIIDWCLQYLNQRKCPSTLLSPLCYMVVEELSQECEKHPEMCGYRSKEDDFLSLRLMQVATRKLIEVCNRFTDNAMLCTLPPPPQPGTLQAAPISVCAVKNCRRTMEDRHVAIQDLHSLFNIKDCGSASYYGVFDGHNGADAAVYTVSHLHQFLIESPHYPTNPELALREAFRKTDDRFKDKSDKENLRSGTTAVCALLRPKESMLYVAWLGDSQAMLVTQGKPYQLVKPHKPDQPEERERIEEMGGTVLYWGTWRVNGQLAVSRAIGDIEYKPYVSGDPDVRVIPLTGQEEFLVLACDGLWDFMTEAEVTETIYTHLTEHPGDITGVSERLVQVGKEQGSNDNISVLVVFLKDPEGGGGCGGMEASVYPEVYRKANGRTQGPFDEEDFGPETDVDSVDDVLLSPDIVAAKALAARAPLPVEEVPNDVVEGEAEESGEDSEEEWNYIRGDDKEAQEKPEEELSESDMESRLNPNAAEFVPSIPLDPVVASSPAKGVQSSFDNVIVPSEKEFEKEISQRPSELEEFVGKAQPVGHPQNGGDDFEVLSTKAEFGDDSTLKISPSTNVAVGLLSETEHVSPKPETNPFLNNEDIKKSDILDFTKADFVTDHFSAPDEPLKKDVNERELVSSPEPDSQEDDRQEVVGTIQNHDNFNQDVDSPYDFMFNGDKSDAVSPVEVAVVDSEFQTNNQEPTSSSGFDSESNEEIDLNIQEKPSDSTPGITFGDDVNLEEIIKAKNEIPSEAQALIESQETQIGRPITPLESLILESKTEILSPFVNIRSTEEETMKPFEELTTPEDSPRRGEETIEEEVKKESDVEMEEKIIENLSDTEEILQQELVKSQVEINQDTQNIQQSDPSPFELPSSEFFTSDKIASHSPSEKPVLSEQFPSELSSFKSPENELSSNEDLLVEVAPQEDLPKEIPVAELASSDAPIFEFSSTEIPVTELSKEVSHGDILIPSFPSCFVPSPESHTTEIPEKQLTEDKIIVEESQLTEVADLELPPCEIPVSDFNESLVDKMPRFEDSNIHTSVLKEASMASEVSPIEASLLEHHSSEFEVSTNHASTEPLHDISPIEVPTSELSPSEICETKQTVDFIQQLQFNESVKEMEAQKNESNESDLEASFEIISHETAKELQIAEDNNLPSGKESLLINEKLLLDQNELEPQISEHSKGIVESPDVCSGEKICAPLTEVEETRKEDLLIESALQIDKNLERLLDLDQELQKEEVENHKLSSDNEELSCKEIKLEEIPAVIPTPVIEPLSETTVTDILEDVTTAPPPTPAPGVTEEKKEDLIAAAIAAAGATTAVVVGTAAVLTAESMIEKPVSNEKIPELEKLPLVEKAEVIEKPKEAEKSPTVEVKKSAAAATAAIQKKPLPGKTTAPAKPGVKSPTKPTATTPTKKAAPTPAAKPASKPASATGKTATSTKPTTPTTPKPPTPTSKTTTKPASKPSTPVTKSSASVPAKTSPKPTTPTAPKPKELPPTKPIAKTTAPAKPKPATTTTARPPTAGKTTEKPPVKKEEPIVKKTVASTKSAAPVPAAKAAPPKPPTAGAPKAAPSTTKAAPSKPAVSKTAAPKPSAPAPAKPAASTTKPATTTTANKPAAKTTTLGTKPAASAPAKPKAPAAAAPKTKPLAPAAKKTAPSDKSVKDAANNKLSSVKSVPKKVDSKVIKNNSEIKKNLLEEKQSEPLTQEHSVTTTNGHLDIIENGVQNGDSPLEKPHPEIIEAQLM